MLGVIARIVFILQGSDGGFIAEISPDLTAAHERLHVRIHFSNHVVIVVQKAVGRSVEHLPQDVALAAELI